jgi:hypothetical protein
MILVFLLLALLIDFDIYYNYNYYNNNFIDRQCCKEEIFFRNLDEDVQNYYLSNCEEMFGLFSCFFSRQITLLDSVVFLEMISEVIKFLCHFEPEEKELIARFQADVSTINDKEVSKRFIEIGSKWLELMEFIGTEELNKYYLKNLSMNPKFIEHLREKSLDIDGYVPKLVLRVYGSISNEEFNQHMKEYDWDFVEG